MYNFMEPTDRSHPVYDVTVHGQGLVCTFLLFHKFIGLFCRILSLLYGCFAKEIYNFIQWICTGWRRFIGPPKLQIIFQQRATKYRSSLQRMTYKDKGSYEFSPPCMLSMHMFTEYVHHWHIYWMLTLFYVEYAEYVNY